MSLDTPVTASASRVHEAVLDWYAVSARELPWRGGTAWEVYVSEVMSHQTPVARVEPAWRRWMQRWPQPAALAADSPGAAVREWGRLGYPRRALRLHESAMVMTREHDGQVPGDLDALLALPGVGPYTAAAVLAFAFGKRATVLDVNIRRVQARLFGGQAIPASSVSRAETALATALLPELDERAAAWNAAVMELGALVCTARSPACEHCPVRQQCAWRAAGYPASRGPGPRRQAWAGTDRQVRGRIMAVLRDAPGPVPQEAIRQAWPDAAQRERCLESLLADGLIVRLDPGQPGGTASPGSADDPGRHCEPGPSYCLP